MADFFAIFRDNSVSAPQVESYSVRSSCFAHQVANVQQDLEPMRCETTSSVKECALRVRSTHGVHHAIVEVNVVIGVVLGEVLVAHVVPLVVDAIIGLTLGLIAHVVIVVFVVAIIKEFS